MADKEIFVWAWRQKSTVKSLLIGKLFAMVPKCWIAIENSGNIYLGERIAGKGLEKWR